MKKKFIAVSMVLGALALSSTTLTSCVDDTESASVTAIRDAKAQQLAALAAVSNADAEVQKAEALLKQAQAADLTQKTEQSKQEFEAQIETLRAQWEQQLLNYKQQIANASNSLRSTVFRNFQYANDELKRLEGEYIEAQLTLAEAQAGVKNAEVIAKQTILALDEEIARNNAKIEAYKALPANSHDELIAQIDELTVQIDAKYASVQIKDQAKTDAETAYEDSKVAYEGDYVQGVEIEPTLKAGIAIKDIQSNYYYSNILEQVANATPEDAEYYSIEKYALNDAQVANVRRQLELKLTNSQNNLGKETDEANYTGSVYAKYNADKKAMDDAKKAWDELKADKDASQTDIDAAEQTYLRAQQTYLNATSQWGYLTQAKKAVTDAQETLDEFEANVKVLDPAGQDYKDYEAAISATIEAGKAYDAAYHEWEVEKLAYAELLATRQVAQNLLTGNPDIDVQIAQCEAAIAEAEAKKVTAGKVINIPYTYTVAWTADQAYVNSLPTNQYGEHIDRNGTVVNVGDYLDGSGCKVTSYEEAAQITQYSTRPENAEAFLKQCEADVENLKLEVEAQKLIVAQCKAELEAAINSGSIEAPAEEETPAE